MKNISRLNRSLLVVLSLVFLLFPFGKSFALTISPPIRELSGDPGKGISGTIKVYNETKEDIQVSASALDFTAKEDEAGNPNFTTAQNQESHDLASWIKLPADPITVKALDWQNVTFDIEIPQNAEPGGHYAAVFFTPSKQQVGGPGTVGVNYQTGSLLLLTVSGPTKQEGSIKEFITKLNKIFYDSLPAIFELRIENTGNVHFKPGGFLEVRNMLGQKVTDMPIVSSDAGGNVLPNSIRRYELFWGDSNEKNWPQGFFDKVKYEWQNFHLGMYKAKADVLLPQGKSDSRELTFWMIPWQLLIIVVIVLAILYLIFRQYNRWIIKKAQEANQKPKKNKIK